MKPCEWCDRETQVTCPECKGTGIDPDDYQIINGKPYEIDTDLPLAMGSQPQQDTTINSELILNAVMKIEIFPHGVNYKPAVEALTNLIAQEANKAELKGRIDELEQVHQCGHNTQAVLFRLDILRNQLWP